MLLLRVAARVWDHTPRPVRAALLHVLPLPRFRVGALAVIQRDDGRVLLLRHRFRVGGAWGVPGGWVERLEDPRDAIVRELHEELGLAVPRDAPALIHLESRTSRSHLEVFYRLRADVGDVPPNPEFVEHGYFAAAELPDDMLPLHRDLVARLLAGG